MEKKRKELISKILQKFMDNDKIQKMPMELCDEAEVDSLKAHLYEQDIEIEILIVESNLSNGMLRIILEKTHNKETDC